MTIRKTLRMALKMTIRIMLRITLRIVLRKHLMSKPTHVCQMEMIDDDFEIGQMVKHIYFLCFFAC